MVKTHLPDIIQSEPLNHYISASEAKRALFIGEEQFDGTVRFSSAGILFENSDPATLTATSKPKAEGAEMKPSTATSALTWVATVIPIVAAIAGATIWVNSTIESKSRENRLEMKADLSDMQKDFKTDLMSMKQDIATQNFRTQDSIQRMSERTDDKLDEINKQVTGLRNDISHNK